MTHSQRGRSIFHQLTDLPNKQTSRSIKRSENSMRRSNSGINVIFQPVLNLFIFRMPNVHSAPILVSNLKNSVQITSIGFLEPVPKLAPDP